MVKIEFFEFQEYDPQNNASQAKLFVRRSDTEVGMVTAHHLGGRLGADVGASVGLGKMPSVGERPKFSVCPSSQMQVFP